MIPHLREVLLRYKIVVQATFVALFGILGAVLLNTPSKAYACTAPPPPWPPATTPRNYVPYATDIFVGHVITTSAHIWPFAYTYTATVHVSTTLKGNISNGTDVIVDGFGSSVFCKTDIAPSSELLLFFARSASVAQLNIVYRLSGSSDRAGVFPATESNLSESLLLPRIWLPVVYRS